MSKSSSVSTNQSFRAERKSSVPCNTSNDVLFLFAILHHMMHYKAETCSFKNVNTCQGVLGGNVLLMFLNKSMLFSMALDIFAMTHFVA